MKPVSGSAFRLAAVRRGERPGTPFFPPRDCRCPATARSIRRKSKCSGQGIGSHVAGQSALSRATGSEGHVRRIGSQGPSRSLFSIYARIKGPRQPREWQAHGTWSGGGSTHPPKRRRRAGQSGWPRVVASARSIRGVRRLPNVCRTVLQDAGAERCVPFKAPHRIASRKPTLATNRDRCWHVSRSADGRLGCLTSIAIATMPNRQRPVCEPACGTTAARSTVRSARCGKAKFCGNKAATKPPRVETLGAGRDEGPCESDDNPLGPGGMNGGTKAHGGLGNPTGKRTRSGCEGSKRVGSRSPRPRDTFCGAFPQRGCWGRVGFDSPRCANEAILQQVCQTLTLASVSSTRLASFTPPALATRRLASRSADTLI